MDVNNRFILNAEGHGILSELKRRNARAHLNSSVNGLTADISKLIIGAQNPEIKLTSAKGEFKNDTAVEIDFGTTGLTKASFDIDANDKTIAVLKTTGTVAPGAISITVGPESLETEETIGTVKFYALHDIEEETKNIAWAMEEVAKKYTPATPKNLKADVDKRRVDFTWTMDKDEKYYRAALEYLVVVTGEEKEYKIRTAKFHDYLSDLKDGTYKANIKAISKDGYESPVSSDITFIIDNVADATFSVATTLVEGSTAGDVIITIKDSEWIEDKIAAGITVEGLANPTINVSGTVLTLSYTGLSGITAGQKQITIAKETNKDGIAADVLATIGNAPSVGVSGTVKQYAGGTLTLTLTGATFADDVTGITAPSGANVPVIAKTGENTVTLTYANADLGNIDIAIPTAAIKEAVALSTSYNVADTATITMSVTTTLTNGATEGTVVATLSEGNFKTGADVFTNWEVIGCNLDGQTPTITIEGGKATLTYTGINATGGTVFVQALDTITPNGTNLIATIGFDRVTAPTVQAVYENSSPWNVGTAYNVELKMNAGDYGGENYTAQWTDFDAAEWTKVEMQNKSDSSWIDITALLTSSGGQLGQQLNVWTGSQYIRLTPAYVAEGESTRTAKLVVTSVQGSWDPIEVDMSFNINNVEV